MQRISRSTLSSLLAIQRRTAITAWTTSNIALPGTARLSTNARLSRINHDPQRYFSVGDTIKSAVSGGAEKLKGVISGLDEALGKKYEERLEKPVIKDVDNHAENVEAAHTEHTPTGVPYITPPQPSPEPTRRRKPGQPDATDTEGVMPPMFTRSYEDLLTPSNERQDLSPQSRETKKWTNDTIEKGKGIVKDSKEKVKQGARRVKETVKEATSAASQALKQARSSVDELKIKAEDAMGTSQAGASAPTAALEDEPLSSTTQANPEMEEQQRRYEEHMKNVTHDYTVETQEDAHKMNVDQSLEAEKVKKAARPMNERVATEAKDLNKKQDIMKDQYFAPKYPETDQRSIDNAAQRTEQAFSDSILYRNTSNQTPRSDIDQPSTANTSQKRADAQAIDREIPKRIDPAGMSEQLPSKEQERLEREAAKSPLWPSKAV